MNIFINRKHLFLDYIIRYSLYLIFIIFDIEKLFIKLLF